MGRRGPPQPERRRDPHRRRDRGEAALLWHYREPREAAEAPALAVEDTEFYAAVNQIAFRQMWGGEDVVEAPETADAPVQHPADPASAPAVWNEAA